MTSRFLQAPGAVVMIRPHRFPPNPETASDNAFQRTDGRLSPKEIAKAAYNEVTDVADGKGATILLRCSRLNTGFRM